MNRQEINEQKNHLYTEKMDLEQKLSGSDYKIIKVAEANAAGQEELPYDINALHTQRQAWRDRINAIEAEIERLDAEIDEDEPEEPAEGDENVIVE